MVLARAKKGALAYTMLQMNNKKNNFLELDLINKL